MDQFRKKNVLSSADLSRVVEMAWEDRTPFEAIDKCYRLSEKDVIMLMRRVLKKSSFKQWRTRVSGRRTKHLKIRGFAISRAYCSSQYKHR